MTAPETPQRPAGVATAAWLPAATAQQFGLADLVGRADEEALVLGIAAGSARVLARELRSDGRLGPAVRLGSAAAGEVLVVPAGGNGLRVLMQGSEDLQATVLEVAAAGDQAVGHIGKAHECQT